MRIKIAQANVINRLSDLFPSAGQGNKNIDKTPLFYRTAFVYYSIRQKRKGEVDYEEKEQKNIMDRAPAPVHGPDSGLCRENGRDSGRVGE